MRLTRTVITVFCWLFLLSGTLLFFVSEKTDWSENENRYLASFPEYSFDSLKDGRFTAGIEEYTKDHFPARDSFMQIKTGAQLFMGYKEISDVYVGENRLFQKVTEPDSTKFTKSVALIKENISSEDVTVSVMLLPTASFLYAEEMPSYAPVLDQKTLINQIEADSSCDNPLNLCDGFLAAKDSGNLYYTSDHHWTSYAAYTAYTAFCDSVALPYAPLSDYTVSTVTDSFRGTLFSRVLDPRRPADSIQRYDLTGNRFEAFYAGSSSQAAAEDYTPYSYYDDNALQKKDKYLYFGGDNYPVVVLKTPHAATNREIVVAKDSFANCFAPFLTENYSVVYMLDQRYLKGKSVSDFVNEHANVTDVLILYGLNSLNDNSGVGMLY